MVRISLNVDLQNFIKLKSLLTIYITKLDPACISPTGL